MSGLNQILTLIEREVKMEWRQKYAINGLLLYVGATVFICYLSFHLQSGAINIPTWNALFWIILLFAGINAVAKSFLQESEGRNLYWYQLTSPEYIIIAKGIYNTFLLLLLGIVCLGFYSMVIGNPIEHYGVFLTTLFLGLCGFSFTLTMVSGIAAKANNSGTLMAILSFPVIIPVLLMALKLSKGALLGVGWEASAPHLLTLLAINVIVGAMSVILFPYLWRS
ncbi:MULTISPECIES: heme exporter protein CcmB [Persicobacter]|uniref:Cytochrome C biogenesis protein CcmB n=1 Tax=Persicobacter diffluens TaxID=981 RepID=A0AAN5AM32_9BACT|nr:heme exporter protein CcmB [Persicobacter sp. CCB-QB2]GJM62006.1 cytochrome C biogenesis protein CcmB [Persicobacter diffluens]